MIKLRFFLLAFFFIGFLGPGCKESKEEALQKLEVVRIDQLLMELDTLDIQSGFEKLENKYPDFMAIYFREVLPLPGFVSKNDTFFESLKGFITDPGMNEIYGLIQKSFGDFEDEVLQISRAMDKAKTWFPDSPSPRIYTFISEFSYQQFLFEDAGREGLAIGLDLFLGDAFDYSVLSSGRNAFSQYLTRTYDKTHLTKKVMDAWVEDKMGFVTGDRLVDHMIYNGTKLVILDDVLELPDSIILEQPEEKVEWLENNEKELWSFYFKNNWFYSTDQYVIKRLVEPAPNSMALKMPQAAPGQTGNFLGWQIMKSYLKRFPETGIETILSTDAQQILEASKYKPGAGGI